MLFKLDFDFPHTKGIYHPDLFAPSKQASEFELG